MTTKMVPTLEDYTDITTNEIIHTFPRKTIQVYFDGCVNPAIPGEQHVMLS
jgi:hypothetical protein